MADTGPICRARLLSDLTGQTACDQPATSVDGRLCAFHSRQCQALYRGYKKRNAELDALANEQPLYLKSSKTSLATLDFKDVNQDSVLRELHDYIFKRYNLLDRVIQARRLHHSHFFAIDNDYGHEKYLDRLQNERFVMAKSLEKLGRRGAEVMYEQQQWFDWVKKAQEDEESQRETEAKKVKLESLLFKRYQKEVERHQREIKAREDKKREEEFLNDVYVKRLAEMSMEEEQDDDEWDPVHDIFGYERENYVDLIKFFLMLKDQDILEESTAELDVTGPSKATESKQPEKAGPEKALSKSAKKRAKKANAEMKKLADPSAQVTDGRGSGIIEMETRAQMRKRLRSPVKFERPKGWYFAPDEDIPATLPPQTPHIPEDEIEKVLDEVAEIKNFLFCRLLLSQATLLPVALEANNIEEFLANDRVTRQNLRDLCIKLERPGLQDVRDACADFVRGEKEDDEPEEAEDANQDSDDSEEDDKVDDKYALKAKSRFKIPRKYQTKREKAKATKQPGFPLDSKAFDLNDNDGPIDFGKITDESRENRKRTRIKVCGRYMYNYPSEKSLQRDGWFHFSIIAKDSELFDAIELCRNWNEFFELNILCMHHFFPAPKWTMFTGDILRQQLLQLGVIPYFLSNKAESMTHYFQSGSRGMHRRAHQYTEMRNFLCAHIRRDDPVSRRFIQYLSMETWNLRTLVRDRKTGRVLIQPPDEELWILREKSGWGRAAKRDYEIITEVGPVFFETMDKIRQWHFGFEEYYDVYIWDAAPGRPFTLLQRKIEETMSRALRVRELIDMFSVTAPILKTLHREPDTKRVRSIKPNENVPSMFDELKENARSWRWTPEGGIGEEVFEETYIYTEADELEDAILFPSEATGDMKNNLFKHVPNAMELFEKRPVIDVRRFAADLDTDEDLSPSDEDDLDISEESDDGYEFDIAGGNFSANGKSNCIKDKNDESKLAELNREGELGSPVDDDGDSAWDTENESVAPNEEDVMEAIDMFTENFKASLRREPDYFVSIVKNPSRHHKIPASVRENPCDLMGALRIALRSQKKYGNSHNDIETDFFRHIDRQKSKVFKQCWHMADGEPGARVRYLEWEVIVEAMDNYIMSKLDTGPFELCKFMEMAREFTQERRVVDDAFKAYASIAVFYETKDFLESEYCWAFSKSKIFNQEERAKDLPNRRTHLSNKTMPKGCWAEWDKILKDNNRRQGDEVEDLYPMEWRKAIRPVIMRLFKAGVICSSYGDGATGLATAYAEPGRSLDLYLDYRVSIPSIRALQFLTDPTPLDRSYILNKARRFREKYPEARFAALRMWSAPHFYPLMLGLEKRELCSFLDDRGRCWEFKFIPKDMPFSEWSAQQQLSLRIEPYRSIFGSRVFVARDLVMVMGENASELRKLAAAATWAVQTKPWRLEIDFWRSFVNVDLKFLERLHPKWLE